MSSPPSIASASQKRQKTARAPLREAKAALYREHILAAAEAIFAEQGVDATKMQDIAREVGISLGTLYQSFAGKGELHRAILISRSQQMVETVTQRGVQVLVKPTGVEPILWLIGVQVQFLLDHRDYLRIQLQQGFAWYHATSWPSAEEERLWKQGLEQMRGIFAWGQAQKWFVPGDGTDLAQLMMALQQARLMHWVSAGMVEDAAPVIARIQTDFVRQFCRPSVALTLLSEDGSQLSARALASIAALNG
ncbi:TetR/AcrR family transcriptional regulator [Sinimarinibacterium sp. NLF-5-8]|uniref:TetR/AcrR family transcriptional regulator n=1 Tax=Sinimarinibacterium sp. NLF-5-8 TaxID=2698684 RepID=UPI00137BCBA4|nr:TetR/AcrR family transcriptional regulator [Sinimarinibacterium sp. NLF-5-8]QHS10063.1 TetR/AcrR family transcriptional regulator [Sinimarinibacterium sp. NLF-5-8]